MCYCQSNILYKMVLSINLFAALCDLNPIMHSSKHIFCVAHYKWVQPISVLTFAIFSSTDTVSFHNFFPWHKQWHKTCCSKHGIMERRNQASLAVTAQAAAPAMVLALTKLMQKFLSVQCVTSLQDRPPLVPAALKPALYSNSRLVTTHLVVAPLAPSLKKELCNISKRPNQNTVCNLKGLE